MAGTAAQAALDGIRSAGKTGTTQSYRDAWYVGFTGNYTAAVWMGNDDFTATNNMTGGSLPAMTWQRLMTYAHQNIELKPIPGLPEMPAAPVAEVPAPQLAAEGEAATAAPQRPATLSGGTTRLLRSLSERLHNARKLGLPVKPETLSAL